MSQLTKNTSWHMKVRFSYCVCLALSLLAKSLVVANPFLIWMRVSVQVHKIILNRWWAIQQQLDMPIIAVHSHAYDHLMKIFWQVIVNEPLHSKYKIYSYNKLYMLCRSPHNILSSLNLFFSTHNIRFRIL